MLVVDEQHMVQYLSARAAHKALGHGIHVRRSNCCSDHLRADALRRAVECRAELVVAVPQQHGRRFPSIVALRSCCAVHAWVGWRVAATWTTRRDVTWTMKNA